MRAAIVGKIFLATLLLALLQYGLTPAGLGALFKNIALGLALSIGIAIIYPEARAIRRGDAVSAVTTSFVPSLIGRMGQALESARRGDKVRIKFDNGEEALGVVEAYAGWISPPRIRVLYQEKAVELR